MTTEINDGSTVYTYRNGKKLYLKKQPDQFVLRTDKEKLDKLGLKNAERTSPSSFRVTAPSNVVNETMDVLRNTAVVHHAYYKADNGQEFLITDRIIVGFKHPVSDEMLDEFTAKYGLLKKERYSDKEFLFQLTNYTGMNPLKLVVLLKENEPLVEYAENDLNTRPKKYAVQLPTDVFYQKEWHLHTHFTNNDYDLRSSSRCEDAWLLLNSLGSSDVVVGITDDGCKLNHPDFDSPGKFAAWGYMSQSRLINNADIDADPDKMYQSGSNHGTSCSGVIAGEADGVLTVGAAPDCKLLPVKWESNGPYLELSDSKFYTVLTFIADKIDILSNSWGGSPDNIWSTLVINKIQDLALNGGKRGKGIIFLWAAGNQNCPVNFSGNIDIPYTNGWNFDGSNWTWQGVTTSKTFSSNIADIPEVMYVAALSSMAQRSHYSNYGPSIDICAPTNNVHEYYRMTVRGLGISTDTGEGSGTTDQFGGTSSATPLVAGIAALVISANPSLTATQVVSVLKQTASKDLSLQGYPRTLPTSYDPDTSWDVSPVAPFDKGDFIDINSADGTWSPWFGFGKIDAAAAVAEAIRLLGEISTNVFTKTSSPSKAIPDNNPVGITDIITVDDEGSISELKVSLDVTHTYIGDLIIKIISPHGTSLVLQNRNGGSTKNINQIYDQLNTPALSGLKGESFHGSWILQITDVAAVDTGTLNSWSLTISVSEKESIIFNEEPAIVIPDNDPAGIERTVNTENEGTIQEAEVEVDITHSYIGDLIVSLVTPNGSIVPLHNRTGGSADNIIKTYDFNNNEDLKLIKGEKVQGAWKLKVSDNAGQDVGKLNKWSLRLSLP